MPLSISGAARLLLPFFAVLLVAVSCGSADTASGAGDTPVEPSIALLPPDETPAAVAVDPTTAASTATSPTAPAAAGDANTAGTTDETELAEQPVDMLACLSTRSRVAQVLITLATQPELADARTYAANGELGGIGLLGSPDQGLVDELTALQQESFVPILVASDEEGGSVQRLANLLGPIPSAQSSAQSKTPEEVRNEWREYGFRVKAQGIDMIFGPVVDVGSGPGIESRSFGSDPATVSTYAQAVMDGLLEAGLTPVMKHFPGHGRASADSHLQLPTTPSFDEMRASDLVPYTTLLGQPDYASSVGVMIGHLAVPGLTGEVPASLSPEAITGVLRTELGFGGLVISDALNMGAIVDTYGRLEALELALVAGTDLLILGSFTDLTPALDHLTMRAETDPAFAAIIDNRAQRVLASKDQSSLCLGAQ